MKIISQSPTDPAFVQNPYPFYAEQRPHSTVFWQDYNMPCVFDYETVETLLRDKRFGRECPPEFSPEIPDRLRPFYDIEAHSMLELEAPRHTRLRGLVLRAFTSRRIAGLGPEIAALAQNLADSFPKDGTDLLPIFCTRIPVIIIARLLGVPESMADDLLRWSNDMVMMYQANKSREKEDRAIEASKAFSDFIRSYIKEKRANPADDLITHLIAAEEEGTRLTTDELITTCILLLNAGHEATVHTMGNGIKTLLQTDQAAHFSAPNRIEGTIEEIMRYDPPLHMFTRYCYETLTIGDLSLKRGDQIGLMYGATGRDPNRWENPDKFDPARKVQKNHAFGGGIHFCVGAPLARLELVTALPILFERLPQLTLAETPQYADIYHFHGLSNLPVSY